MPVKESFTPKIVAFCCNWCSYAGADLAGSSRLSYPARCEDYPGALFLPGQSHVSVAGLPKRGRWGHFVRVPPGGLPLQHGQLLCPPPDDAAVFHAVVLGH